MSGPDADPLPWMGTEHIKDAACVADWQPFKSLQKATAIWSRNNDEYENYSGIDLEPDHEPWRPDEERRMLADGHGNGDWYTSAQKGTLVPGTSGQVMVGSCKGKTHKLGTWHTQRVGPFTSVGGYDWHQISWVDPAFISTAFPAGGGTAGILGHFTGPVDADGTTAIGYPPIHQHHVHVVPAPHDVFLEPVARWTNNRLMVIHGDWGFESLGSGPMYTQLQAMGQEYMGWQKLVDQTPSINLELNDVRTAGSDPMTFYYQISLRVASPQYLDKLPALSYMKTHNVASQLTFGGQSAAVSTYPNLLATDTHMWYSSKWPIASRLVSVYPHMHQTVHQETFLFASTAQDLGLGVDNPFQPERMSTASDQMMTGDNAQLRARVMAKAEEKDSLVCSAKGRGQVFTGGYPVNTEKGTCFDRAAYPVCFTKTWAKHEPFTVLSLNGPNPDCGTAKITPGTRHNAHYWGPEGSAAQHAIFFISMAPTDPDEQDMSMYPTLLSGDPKPQAFTIARRKISNTKASESSSAVRSPAGATSPAMNITAATKSETEAQLSALAQSIELNVFAQSTSGPSKGKDEGAPGLFSAVFFLPGLAIAGVIAMRRRYRRQYESLAATKGERAALAAAAPPGGDSVPV